MKRIFTLILLMAIIAFCRTMIPAQYRVPEIRTHNINNVECCVSNYGKFGQSKAGNAGLWWPKGSGENYIYGAGPWFGTIDGSDTLVTIGYGPHGGEAEYTPGLKDMSSSDPNAIIFMYPSPWPPPLDVFLMAPQINKSSQDSWCAYNDLDINSHIPGDTRPIGLEVYQTIYAWNLTTTADIIFIRYELKNVSEKKLTNCYFGVATDNDIGNESGTNANDIISGIVGQWYVIDGESLWVDNLGYQWQVADESGWPDVGAIGFDYLQSPWDLKVGQDKDNDGIPDQYERDSSYYDSIPAKWDVDGDGTPDWRDPSEIPQIGMSAFKRFTLNLEPNKDNERYVTLAGYNFKTGNYEPYDTVPPQADDQRFLQCSGPFELEADSIVVVLVGIMLTYWPRGVVERPDTALAKLDQTVQYIYDMNWLLPGPPPPPKLLTCVPGDARVTLVWDNYAEFYGDPYYDVVSKPGTPNYDPYYKKYDFEGYRVWRSPSGKTGTWSLLTSYDLANGITFTDTTMPDSIALSATDIGLIHSYIDNDVRNGFGYYYAVTAFDYNFVKSVYDSIFIIDSIWYAPDSKWVYVWDTVKVTGPKALYFESGLTGVVATPRRDPINLSSGTLTKTMVSGNTKLLDITSGIIAYPLDTEDDSFFIQFALPSVDSIFEQDSAGNLVKRYRSPYICYLLDNGQNPLDSTRSLLRFGTTAENGFGLYKGIVVQTIINAPNFPVAQSSIFDTVIVTGSYPDSLVLPQVIDNNSFLGAWAYRGNDYEIIWKAINSVVKTVVVIDKSTGDTIPYKCFNNADSTVQLADGWCFAHAKTANWKASDTLILTGGPPNTTKFLYICGGLIALNKGSVPSQRPSDGDVWTAGASSELNPAPVCGLIKFVIKKAQLRTDTTYTLNVKVVPNPYLINNEWQQSSLIRRLRFINLPGECTIRIFTLNGDLIKTILHKATIGSVQGDAGGDEWWDLLTENRQLVASGVYIFHIDSKVGEQVGKFVIIR